MKNTLFMDIFSLQSSFMVSLATPQDLKVMMVRSKSKIKLSCRWKLENPKEVWRGAKKGFLEIQPLGGWNGV